MATSTSRIRETIGNKNGNITKVSMPMQDSVEGIKSSYPLPYLEDIVAIAQKYPYAALGAMIAVAGIIVASVVTVAVAVFTGMFLMYGEMKSTTANQVQIQQTLVVIQKQQTDDMNAVRAYASNNARRVEFIVAMLAPEGQRRVAQWDKDNPQPELPGTKQAQQ